MTVRLPNHPPAHAHARAHHRPNRPPGSCMPLKDLPRDGDFHGAGKVEFTDIRLAALDDGWIAVQILPPEPTSVWRNLTMKTKPVTPSFVSAAIRDWLNWGSRSLAVLSEVMVFAMLLLSGPATPAMETQVDIPLVTQMNRLPSPLNIPNWKQDALDYSQFIFDPTVTGTNMPVVNVVGQDFAFPGYLQPFGENGRTSTDVNSTEAMTSVAPVIAAELLGMDMKTYKGLNWVRSCKRWFNPGAGYRGLYSDGPNQSGSGGYLDPGIYGYWPMAIGMMLTARHRDDPDFNSYMSLQCESVLQIARAYGCPTSADFSLGRSYDQTTLAVHNLGGNGRWVPGMSAGLGWMLYMGYLWTGDSEYLACAQSAMQFHLDYPGRGEIAHQYGPLALARLNAEQGTYLDLGRMMDNFFGDYTRMPSWVQSPPDGYNRGSWSVSRGWNPGGVQADGLDMDSRQNGGVGYAFTMGSYQNTAWLAPVARYDQRFARSIGRFLLNAANSCRLLRGIDLDSSHQAHLGWRNNLVYHGVNKGFLFSYEGLRWESFYPDPSGATHAPYGTGDYLSNTGAGFGGSPSPAADYWNAKTNYNPFIPSQSDSTLSYFENSSYDIAMYMSNSMGFLGAIYNGSSEPGIIGWDLATTDYFHPRCYPSHLFWNPYPTTKSVTFDFGSAPCDLYDTVSGVFVARNVQGNHTFTMGADQSMVLVATPANGVVSQVGTQLRSNGVVVDYRCHGTGLLGEYFNNASQTDRVLARTDAQVNFAWGSGSPGPAVSSSSFSARWSGWLVPPYSEAYTLSTVSGNQVRLWVNDQLVIDRWTNPTASDSCQIALTANQPVSIRLDFANDTTSASGIQLHWSSPSQAAGVIPSARLTPAAGGGLQGEYRNNSTTTSTNLSLVTGPFAPLSGNNLIASNAGTSALSITTASDGRGTASSLTNGNLGTPDTTGALGIRGGTITYDLGNGDNGTGFDINCIRTLTAWQDSGRINQQYTASYSTDGVGFTPLITVNYTASPGANGTDVTRVFSGISNAKFIKFDFGAVDSQQNGWVRYSELAVLGTSTGSGSSMPLVMARPDSNVNFNWSTTPPATLLSGNNLNVRWTGWLVPKYSETHTLTLNAGDGARLAIDNQLLINTWANQTTNSSVQVALTKGKPVRVFLEYYNSGLTPPQASLLWASPSQPSPEIIPSEQWLPPAGNGLAAEYFNNTSLTNVTLVRTDAQVNFDWTGSSPDPAIYPNQFSTRWSGWLLPRHSETHTLTTTTAAGVRLWINDQLLIDDWTSGLKTRTCQVTLTAGQLAMLRLECFNNSGNGRAQLSWSSTSQAMETIPQCQLIGPATVPGPAPAASPPPNLPPLLTALADQTIRASSLLSIAATATDLDLPPQTLTYSLDPGAPSGASINPTTGLFTWTPSVAQYPGNYAVTVRVTDNGNPSRNATGTFNVTVTAPPPPPPVVTETDLSFTGGSFGPLAGTNLILNNPGDSSALNYFEATGGWTPANLTDGDLKAPGTVGNGAGVYSILTRGTVTYQLGGGATGTGYTITGIRSLTSWSGGGRVRPNYTVNFSLDGVNFYPIATVNFLAPDYTQGANLSQGTDVTLGVTGLTNAVSIQFVFPNTQQNGGVSYTELAVFGTPSGLTHPTPTQLVLGTSVTPSSPGASVTFTVTVQDNGVTAGSATGNIVFQVDGSDVSTSAIANGSATYTTSTLAAGTHTITATYSGDAGYATSTTSLTHTVYQLPTVAETNLSLTGGSFAPQGANNLLLGNAGTATLTTVAYTGTAANLTDGVLQAPGSPGASSQIVMIQSGTVTYSLGNGSAGLGYTLTGIRSLTAWANNTRINPKYTVSYSFDGITFIPLATVNYAAPTGAKGTDVSLGITGLTHVKYLRFTFPNSQQNSGVAYSELAAYGTSTPMDPLETWISGLDWSGFTSPDLTAAGDPDGDGMSNHQEFAFGLDPTTGSSASPITVPLDKATGKFSYTRRAASGCTYHVLTSTDLQTWTEEAYPVDETLSGTHDDVQTMQVTVHATALDGKLFVRVHAVP
ncbi:MAG: PA14 domain-containing protein [Verrucomicrobia bacterium]|nr:PA14 domain-containing protein [Verrucomicrobiota bacterium]